MSERGSFVTEYIYCKKCFEAAWEVLNRNEKWMHATIAHGYGEVKSQTRIISGGIGGLYPRQEIDDFKYEIIPLLQNVICCPLRMAVLAETGWFLTTIKPKGKDV